MTSLVHCMSVMLWCEWVLHWFLVRVRLDDKFSTLYVGDAMVWVGTTLVPGDTEIR